MADKDTGLYPDGIPVTPVFRDYLGRRKVIVELPSEPKVRKVLRQHTHTVTIPPSPSITYEHVHAVLVNNPEHLHGSAEERSGA